MSAVDDLKIFYENDPRYVISRLEKQLVVLELKLSLAKEALEYVIAQGCCCGGCGCDNHVEKKARQALEKLK